MRSVYVHARRSSPTELAAGLAPAIDPINANRVPVFVACFQQDDGIRDVGVTGVQTCALPISPVGFLRRCDGVAFECDRADAARFSIAGHPTPWQRRRPDAVARGSQSPPPFPDRATVRRRFLPGLPPALGAAF